MLLLTDPIDEWVVNHLNEYQEKPLKSIAKGALDLDAPVNGYLSRWQLPAAEG